MVIFNSYVKLPEGNQQIHPCQARSLSTPTVQPTRPRPVVPEVRSGCPWEQTEVQFDVKNMNAKAKFNTLLLLNHPILSANIS